MVQRILQKKQSSKYWKLITDGVSNHTFWNYYNFLFCWNNRFSLNCLLTSLVNKKLPAVRHLQKKVKCNGKVADEQILYFLIRALSQAVADPLFLCGNETMMPVHLDMCPSLKDATSNIILFETIFSSIRSCTGNPVVACRDSGW